MRNRDGGVRGLLVPFVLGALSLPVASGQARAVDEVDASFDKLKSYDHDQPRSTLAAIEAYVARSTGEARSTRRAAERLAAVLADPASTQAARVFACTQLALVASDAEVPLLARMLADPATAEPARRALEAIPGEASVDALRAALDTLEGSALVGAVNSLGVRREAGSVSRLARLLEGPDRDVAAAAAGALGRIGTVEAARALQSAEGRTGLRGAVLDAWLACAEHLAAEGHPGLAASLYAVVWESDIPHEQRLAGLSGLARVGPREARPLLVKALKSETDLVRRTAARLLRELPGEDVSAALVRELPGLDAPRQLLVLDLLADRGDRSAAGPVGDFLAGLDVTAEVKLAAAAVKALAALGDASAVEVLVGLAAGGDGEVKVAARTGLARLAGEGVDDALAAAAARGEVPLRVEAVRALAERRAEGATAVLLEAACDADEQVRRAAVDALAATGGPATHRELLRMLVSTAVTDDAARIERAVLAVGSRLVHPSERAVPLLEAIENAPAASRPALLRLLGACGGPEALAAVSARLDDADAATRDAAVRALARWPDLSAADDLLMLARDADTVIHRTLALRGYFRLAREPKSGAARLDMLRRALAVAATPEAKKLFLSCLADVAERGALDEALSLLDDAEVRAEAAAAALRIGKALARSAPEAVIAAADVVIEKAASEAVRKRAEALKAEAMKPSPRAEPGRALVHDKRRSDALKRERAARAPEGHHLVCYLDCGPDASDGPERGKGGPSMRLAAGAKHFWPGSDRNEHFRFGTVFYDGREVAFDISGVSPRKAYRLGFSWWDCDHTSRAQSVWASAAGARRPAMLLGKTKLPSGQRGERPGEREVDLPRALTAHPGKEGRVRLAFRNEDGPNAVVSEIWLWESDAESDPPAGAVAETAATPARDAPATGDAAPRMRKTSRKDATMRVLIVTGIDYPGHKWRLTTPVLKDGLEADPRLGVDVVEDPAFLASPELHGYDVVVFHWMNWKKPAPAEAARANLTRYVREGRGLVLVHFACGAFQDWPEFGDIAGRVWDPKRRGHDRRGRFTVEITEVDHPVTRGLESFEADDELYTCVVGERPIDVLAAARSKVDKKVYPMAFVFDCGKGRVFHCLLGHDVKAFKKPGVLELFRRGTAWAAGRPAVR